MSEVRVVPLTMAEIPAAGALLAASHAHYPAFCHVFPEPAKRARVLPAFQTAATRDATRHGHALAAHRDGSLVGVALWMPPGRFPPGPLRELRMSPGLARAALAAPANFPRFARSGAALARSLPQHPVWYLQALGVRPGTQRAGVGSALLAAGLAAVDAEHLACHLHTSDPANLTYYRRAGFQLTQPAIRADPGGPIYYGMTRPPIGEAP